MGRYSDKRSYARGFELGLYFAAGAFLINVFTTRSTWFFVVVYTILYNCCVAGTNQNSYNITYSYVDSRFIDVYKRQVSQTVRTGLLTGHMQASIL